jgi:hypothetical protein
VPLQLAGAIGRLGVIVQVMKDGKPPPYGKSIVGAADGAGRFFVIKFRSLAELADQIGPVACQCPFAITCASQKQDGEGIARERVDSGFLICIVFNDT